ncbi:hypothetical protein BD289DRAFT_271422 [Coniella lustricola]|uniref:Uncharacterized protein n=1 Tax=Coniella lustricola TaxID=2025994 RepID=A0A2T3AKQ5_9PEZI|nr:hypothetical protein BD289DRAFT_271422 [Coniella lustricola]
MDLDNNITYCDTTLEECIPELSGLQHVFPTLSVYLGGQDFNRGCLLALKESLALNEANHTIVKTANFMFDPGVNVSSVVWSANHGTVCSSTDGTAPLVSVPLEWCTTHLPGWQAENWAGFLGPLVQFILPCVAFCYNIPREWKLRLNPLARRRNSKSEPGRSTFSKFLCAIQELLNSTIVFVKLSLELAILVLDTFLWMSMCFAMAGPMILSAAYEYRLDWNNLAMLAARCDDIPNVSRARLLLCTVAGNMRLHDDVEGQEEESVELLESQSESTRSESTWSVVMSIADEVERLDKQIKQDRSLNPENDLAQNPSQFAADDRIGPRLKLQTLLDAQPGFGGYIGAPVVFFVGGFGYNIADSYNSRGNEVVAITLAFGMWWMYIPHTAVLSNTLLASNDPSTLQGLVGKRSMIDTPSSLNNFQRTRPNQKRPYFKRTVDWLVRTVTKDAYVSTYKPVALWRRGPNKQRWMLQAIRVIRESDECPQNIIEDMERSLNFQAKDWIFAISLTTFLLSIPYTLAFTTSFLTPKKGLSCRSLTHTVFMATQVMQIIIWSFETHRKISNKSNLTRGNPPQRSQNSGMCWSQVVTRTSDHAVRFLVQLLKVLPSLIKWLSRLVAVFAAIGGTLMQIMGVYQNCYCNVDAWSWTDRNNSQSRVTPIGDGISRSEIQASQNWITMGALASGILSTVTAVGWWHRKKLWRRFTEETEKLPDIRPRCRRSLKQDQSVSDRTTLHSDAETPSLESTRS